MSEPLEDAGELHITSETGPWAMVPIWVLDMGLSGAELAVYVSLRSFANQRGDAHPRVKVIAERAGVHIKTAEKAIARFRELLMLTSTQRTRPDGSIAGCSYWLRDRQPVPASTPRTSRAGPRPSAGGGTREVAGDPPAQRREQEHTSEHTRGNTPVEASRTSTEERADGTWAAGTSPSVKALAAHLSGEIMAANAGRVSISQTALDSLLAPALGNGVPGDRLKRAVRMLLHDGQKLAPWTLQEYVAKAAAASSPGVAGW